MTLHFIMDKVINNQMAKKAPRRQSCWNLCQTLKWLIPMGSLCPCSAEEWMAVLHLTADNVWPCGTELSTAQHTGAVLTTGSLTYCWAAHIFILTPKCWVIHPCHAVRKGLISCSWLGHHGTVRWAQRGADTVAAPLLWVATVSSMASCKLDPDISGIREKEEPTENFHVF